MQLPENFNTAVTSAVYITSRKAYPDKTIEISDSQRVLNIGTKQIEIPSLDDLTDEWKRYNGRYQLYIGPYDRGICLDINRDGSFRITYGGSEHDNKLPELQEKIEHALNKTGFTPTRSFNKRNVEILNGYGVLFNEKKWDEHLDSLAKRFTKETEPYLNKAKEIDINAISTAYLDVLVNEACLQLPYFGTRIPYSNLKRGALVMGGLGVSGLIAASKIIPGTEQFSQFYNYLLFNNGIISAVAANAATMSFFYALGDLSAQFIEGRGFDGKRLRKFSCLGAAYGEEFSGFYSLLNPIKYSSKFISSLIKGVIDSLYGVWIFNSRHLYLTPKENLSPIDYFRFDKIFSSFKNSDFRKKWKTLSSYTLLFWLPYQIWNRFSHELPQQVSYVALATPPFTVFISLVSNEKKELDEFMKVMASLKGAA
ncbi:hypothetical protein J4209_05180 [Candidatus Woesearchaeota archaeon]|nr:hypothetical protein [Candidatus Woesearchaeota archaeon]